MKKILYNRLPVFTVLWALVIFVLCATPGQYIPSTDWLELLSFDKLVHASLFFILTALLFGSALKGNANKRTLGFLFFLSVVYGAALELMQAYCFSNRSADWKDMVANALGCVLALLVLKKIRLFVTNARTANAR